MKILTVANEKGGVGKTLVSVQFAFYCAFKFGLKVALLDLDQQGSASNTVKVNSNSAIADISASNFMLEPVESFSCKIESHIPELVSSSNLVCFPADDALSDIEKKGDDFHELVAYYFSENINGLGAYFDLVVIDTNPNPDVRSNLGLAVATHLISPLELNKEPIDGIARLIPRLSALAENNPDMELGKGFLGMLPNKLTSTNFQCKNAQELFNSASDLILKWKQLDIVLDTSKLSFEKAAVALDADGNAIVKETTHYAAIKEHVGIAEAQANGKPIWEMPNQNVAWGEMKRCFFTMLCQINPEKEDTSTDEQKAVFEKASKLYGNTAKVIIKNFWMTDVAASLPGMNLNEIQTLREMRCAAPISIVL